MDGEAEPPASGAVAGVIKCICGKPPSAHWGLPEGYTGHLVLLAGGSHVRLGPLKARNDQPL